jgi:ribosomal protein L37AE/L43A
LSAKAGEVARESGAFRCEGCGKQTTVRVGVVIHACSDCGGFNFQTGWRTLQNQPTKAASWLG